MDMTWRKFGYAFLVFVFLLSGCKKEQVITSLPRSFPETEGVSSQGIIDFLNAAAKSQHEFHSFMFLRHGKVIAEGWWNPYKPELRHTLYSTSKSFTATAVGFAVSEKRLSVNDKVISFFRDALPDSVSPLLSNMKIRDLLSMSAGQDPDPTFKIVTNDSNWITGETTLHGPNLLLLAKAHFLGLPPAKVAGSFGWKDENTLEMVLRYIESPHAETITCKFDSNKVSVAFYYSNAPKSIQPELKGLVKDE